MEDMTVVFFYGERTKKEKTKETGVRERKRRIWDRLRRKSATAKSIEAPCEVQLGTKMWKYCPERKRFILYEGAIPPEGRYVYYVTDRWAEKALGRGREPIGMEWILFLISYYGLGFDSLVLIQDRDMEAEDLIRYFAPKLQYLGVVADFFYDWEEVEESLSGEYGLVLDIGTGLEALHVKGDRTLVIGSNKAETVGEDGAFISGLMKNITGEILWLDTAGRGFKGEKSGFGNRKFVYVNMEHFFRDTLLDTAHKIKYNNTR